MSTLPMSSIESGEAQALAAPKPTTSIVMVTAGTAARWLERNIRNRPLSAFTVERYRRDMSEGRWVYAADPIRFDTAGSLLDGQHRLTALAMCEGLALPFLVVRGLPSETQMVMDQGRKRSAAQQLALKGVKNASNIAAGVKVYILWQSGLMFRDNKVAQSSITTPSIEAWIDGNESTVAHVSAYLTTLRNNDAPPSVTVGAVLRFTELHPDQAYDFFHTLANGGTPVGHPINTLDKRLQRIRREGLRFSQRDHLALFVLAWNATRDGRTLTKFQRPVGGKWTADTFPVPR